MQEESLKKKLKNAFAELYYVWRKKEIIRENILLVYSFDKIATKQYEVGMGIQADIFRAKTELAGLRRDSIQNEQTISSMTAMLNALMNQPVDLPIRKIDWIDVPVFTRTIEQLCTLAQRNRPDLRSMQANIAMLNAEIKVAKKAYYPDFTVKGMYMNAVESKEDNLSVMFGVTIPVAPWSYKKYSSDYSLKQYDDMKNMIYAQIQDALTRVASNNEQLKIALKHTIPYADQTLNATMTAYSNGKTEFLMLIDAQRMILMAHMDHHMAIMGLLQSIAELEQAVGLSLDQIQLSISSREK
jgi:outer membrane protein TolC